MSCTGKLGTPCLQSAQFFHLLNAPMFFLIVLSALLHRTVAGRAAAALGLQDCLVEAILLTSGYLQGGGEEEME